MFCADHGVVLPAGIAEHQIAGGEARRIGFHHFGNGAARHHGIGLDGCTVGRTLHPGAVGRIERDVKHPQQNLAVLGFGNGCFRHLEILGQQLSGRLLDQQNLTIGLCHRHSSAGLVSFYPATIAAFDPGLERGGTEPC